MDQYYSEFEEYLNARLDNYDGLLSEMIDSTNNNSSMIDQTIKDATSEVGYKITDDMSNIWKDTGSGIGKVVADYSSNFNSQLTTTNNYMKSINDLVAKIVNQSVKDISNNTGGAASGGSSGGSSGSSGSSGSGSANKPSSGSGSSSSGSTSKPKGWFFVYKKDSYPKNKLNINQSVVDRLKFHDIDTSWNNMKKYYEGMGLGSASQYVGSYNQNISMLSWLKSNGYSQGGQLKKMVGAAGEDGLFFGRTGEEVLSLDKLRLADSTVTQLIDFAKYVPNVSGRNVSGDTEINMNFNLPNVKDSQSFLKEIKSNKLIQQALVDVTIGKAMGKNSLNVNKRK